MTEDERSPRVRVAAIIRQDDTVLLVRHEKDNQSYWLLPGGGVHFGESLDKALIRELKEEATVDIDVGKLAYVVDAISEDDDRHMIQCSFEADITHGTVAVGSDKRVVEVRFIPIEDIATLNLHPPTNDELIDGLNKGFAQVDRYLGNRWRARIDRGR